MNSTLLKGGLIADGSGGAPAAGDLLMEDGRISALGKFPEPTDCRVVDCAGMIVAPGFIDLHSHADLQVLEGRREKSDQGCTTEVVGNCGFSPYPGGEHTGELREFANGIFCGGADWSFPSARDYLAAIEHASAIGVQSLVGHGSLRIGLFGNRQSALTAPELERMEGVLGDALDAGACGFSTGLMYAPGSGAPFDELERMCRVVARHGRLYATHMRSYSFGLLDAIDEQLALARSTGCRLQISHLQSVGRANWHKQREALDRLEAAHREGIDVEFDIYPYQAGSTVLTQLLPQWALDGGNSRMLGLLSDPDQRRTIAEETRKHLAQDWSDILISAVATPGNQRLVGQTMASIAAERGLDPAEAVIDLLIEESGAVNMVSFNQSEANLREILTHPLASVISDGFYVKGRPHPRLYGTFPHLLGEFCRERSWMPLGQAIHKITAKPAARLGLNGRGTLRPGAVADVTVFDPRTIAGSASYDHPECAPVGIEHVFRA